MFRRLSVSLLALLMLAMPCKAFAWSSMTCPAGTIDTLSWMVPSNGLATQHNIHAGSGQYPHGAWTHYYTYFKPGTNTGSITLTHGPDPQGWPYDILTFDQNYVYEFLTSSQLNGTAPNDPTSVVWFGNNPDGGPNLPWFPRCYTPTNDYSAGWVDDIPGSSVWLWYTSSGWYYAGLGSGTPGQCSPTHAYNVGAQYGVNYRMWMAGPVPLSLGGNTGVNTPTLLQGYDYACDSGYGTCWSREIEYYQKGNGYVKWDYDSWNGSTYVGQHTINLTDVVPGGATKIYNPCASVE
jgi:hypothetical protein